jgi:topoisomerase-4 subunit A
VTNFGQVIYRPVHELPDLKWKDVGDHLSQTIQTFSSEESIIKVILFKKLDEQKNLLLITKNGMIKQTKLTEFSPWRTYKTRSLVAIKLKDADQVQYVGLVDEENTKDIVLVSHRGFALRFSLNEVSVVGAKAAGVKSMNLKEGDFVVSGLLVQKDSEASIVIVTQRGVVKRMLISELSRLTRAKRGLMILRELRTNPHRVIYIGESTEDILLIETNKRNKVKIVQEDYPIGDRTSNGSFVIDGKNEIVESVRKFNDRLSY